MVMLTPTPYTMKPTSFEHFALFQNFSGLRPTLGTVLRITADISSIWIAFLFGWFVVHGNGVAELVTRDSTGIVALVGLSSILACFGYTSAGLYNLKHKYDLLAKIGRIILVNLVLFVIAGVFIMGVVQNAMNLKNVDPFYQYVVSGMILLLAVLFDRVKQMRSGTAI